ncbi:baseplate J/gp47 family protein [Burkholderia anthina]|uniref:baseplate J/gp47 family protein n=1 Tax=Burkholderia anthina TaxID=179879 RepID=UPI00158DC6AB
MPATVLTADQVRDNLLRDIKNLQPEADVGEDSDYFVRASSVGSAVEGLYQHQLWITKQIFPDTADLEYLILHARLRGIDRKPAVSASGTILLAGQAGESVPSGLVAKYKDGTSYVTTSGGDFDVNGQLTVDARAEVAGVGGNRDAGDTLTLTIPPIGVNATVSVVKMLGGTDIESPESLLARLLQRMRRAPAGGNKYDYWQWAMEVPGVTAAYVYPLRRGLGTVDVVIASNGGMPSDETIRAAQAHIDDQRPVTAKNSLVIGPSIRTYDVVAEVALDGISMDTATSLVTSALAAYDAIISPGDRVIKSRIEAVISDVSGISDRNVIEPAANIVPDVDASRVEWFRLGSVQLRSM